ncbi:ribose 5-phosphate isomerase B [Longilinea arvoryzae]|uniref:Ribose 5-phosphate isomerase B n=1 Tax=Longilinea arvoryzae TaxID=360412 RepID=A0A0S7BH97_9CHLR|nr:ribose 5-phosphate isomerase B [Longilinea arvoryzae]GAP14969.1 ribose 5-phosphate isomerase B [Longilinea arvoryzae]
MRVAVSCDHAGFPIKATVIETLRKLGHEVLDFGTDSPTSVDFPDFTEKACRAIQRGEAERGVILCGSGVGVVIAANKMKGIYAGLCHDTYSAHQGVEHDFMNVLCLGGQVIGPALTRELVTAFVNAKFDGGERFVRRVNKMKKLEEEG